MTTIDIHLARNTRMVETTGGVMLVDDDGHVVVNDEGSPASVADLLAVVSGRVPHSASAPTARPANLTTAAIDENKRQRAADAARATEGPNPWSRSSWSFTRQCIIENRDPDQAARLQAEAT